MIALLVALVFLLVNLAAMFPHPGLAPIQPVITFYQENQPDVLLLLVVFYLASYIFLRWRYAKLLAECEESESQTEEKCKPARSTQTEESYKLHRQIRDLDKSLDETQGELKASLDRTHELQSALADAQKRLNAVEQQASKRQPQIDAEIVHLLTLFQAKGRMLDFLMDDITPYTDDQIGRAARVVHQGCKAVLNEYFSIAPVHAGKEGDEISIDVNSPAELYRLVGRVSGTPPYHGRVLHQGWKTVKVSLPRVSKPDSSKPESSELIISPSEIEIR